MWTDQFLDMSWNVGDVLFIYKLGKKSRHAQPILVREYFIDETNCDDFNWTRT